MSIEEVRTELVHLISVLFKDKGFDTELIEYANLIDDLGMDSITFISIVVKIETRFGITVPDDLLLMDNFKTINGINDLVNQILSETHEISEVSANA